MPIRYTLCTYEHPAAIHDLGRWERDMRAKERLLHSPERLVEYGLPVSVYRLSKNGVECEVLYAVGILDQSPSRIIGDTLQRLTSAVSKAEGSLRPWNKALMFGRIPTGARLQRLVWVWTHAVRKSDHS